jgi:hypothetical protein
VKGDANITGSFNLGGYVGFPIRAYVRFNYVSSLVIQVKSALISTVTRSNTGQYTITFSPALPTSNYLVFGNAYQNTAFDNTSNTSCNVFSLSTTSCKINITDGTSNGYVDPEDNCCVFILF